MLISLLRSQESCIYFKGNCKMPNLCAINFNAVITAIYSIVSIFQAVMYRIQSFVYMGIKTSG